MAIFTAVAHQMKRNADKIFEPGKPKLTSIFQFLSFLFSKGGVNFIRRQLRKRVANGHATVDHDAWIRAKKDKAVLQEKFAQNAAVLRSAPKISVIIANGPGVEDTLASVAEQLYTNYEVLRIPGSSASQFNTTLAGVSGAYVLFVEAGTLLTPDCLAEFALHVALELADEELGPADKIVYSASDEIDSAGRYVNPCFRPGWSPDTLLSRNYIGNNFLIETGLLRQLNGLRNGVEGSEYFDLLLRATEVTGFAGLIRYVLFHSPMTTRESHADLRVLQDAMVRRGTPANITAIPGLQGCYNINYQITAPGKVSIIIPTKDQAGLLKTAIDSILNKTNYRDYEIIVVNNNSVTKEFRELMDRYTTAQPDKFRCIDAAIPFNFPKLINSGVAAANGSYLLMLNNDVEVIDSDWLERMVSYAQLKHVGAVGAKLLYPDNTIQHAGIEPTVTGEADHICAHMPRETPGDQNCAQTATNYTALTGACLMCRKEVYNEVGGMDEQLAIEYNDLDLCLKMIQHGYYNVYLPVELYHYESATRGHPFRSRASWRQHEKEKSIFNANLVKRAMGMGSVL